VEYRDITGELRDYCECDICDEATYYFRDWVEGEEDRLVIIDTFEDASGAIVCVRCKEARLAAGEKQDEVRHFTPSLSPKVPIELQVGLWTNERLFAELRRIVSNNDTDDVRMGLAIIDKIEEDRVAT
jgi:hypothetical protein